MIKRYKPKRFRLRISRRAAAEALKMLVEAQAQVMDLPEDIRAANALAYHQGMLKAYAKGMEK